MEYFDLHCDVLYRCVTEALEFDSKKLAVNSKELSSFSRYCQSFAIWTPLSVKDKRAYLDNCLKVFENGVKRYADESFMPVLSVEGADCIGDDLSLIPYLKDKGMFSLSLTWNDENGFAGGAMSDAGLKPQGAAAVRELNACGAVLDVSHLNEKSFFAVAGTADRIIASHSYFSGIFPHRRNLTLAQLRVIKEKKGLVGICFFPAFTGKNDLAESIYDAIVYALENDFADCIAIGSDFDGAEIPARLSDVPDIFDSLIKKGIEEEVLRKVFFQNAFDYYKGFDN